MSETAAFTEHPPVRLTVADLALLWLEKNVSEQCAGGNGGALIMKFTDGRVEAAGVPGWFRLHELGFHFTNAERDILQTMATLRLDNTSRRTKLQRTAEKLIKRFLASAKREGKKARPPVIETPVGCTGCSSCAPGARLRPRRSSNPRTARNFLPYSVRQAHESGWREERREASARRAARRAAGRERRSGARTQMNSRRSEQAAVRRAAARALSDVLAPTPTDE